METAANAIKIALVRHVRAHAAVVPVVTVSVVVLLRHVHAETVTVRRANVRRTTVITPEPSEYRITVTVLPVE